MRTRLFLILLLACFLHAGCTQKSELPRLNALHFRYAAYRWHYGEKEADTAWKLYLYQYIEAYPSGHFRGLRRTMGVEQWVEGTMKPGTQKHVNTGLQHLPLGKDFCYGVADKFIYCGLTYRIDYARPDSPFSNSVEFIPYKNRPGVLKELVYVLDNVVYRATQSGKTLDLKAYEQQLRAETRLPRRHLPNVKFKAPNE